MLRPVLGTLRSAVGSTAAVLAFLGLLNWQSVALAVACVALVVSVVALLRSGRRDDEVAAWRAGQLPRAQAQAAALSDDLRGD